MLERHNPKHKLNMPMCAACILFCLTLLSMHFTGGLLARYTASGSGSDNARVARFEVTEDTCELSKDLVIPFVPGEHESKIEVVNASEVAINYTVTVENVTGNIPFQIKQGEGNAIVGKSEVTYSMPTDSKATCDIKIIWDAAGADAYVGMVDLIRVTVKAEQID